jgi:hypothetical protein
MAGWSNATMQKPSYVSGAIIRPYGLRNVTATSVPRLFTRLPMGIGGTSIAVLESWSTS